MELRDYLSILRRAQAPRDRGVRGCRAVACAVTLLQPAKWTAVATLRVEPSTSRRWLGAGGRRQIPRPRSQHLLTASQQPGDGQPRGCRAPLAAPPDIEFAQVPNTNLVKLKVTTGDRDSAAPAARRVTSLLISQVETLAAADVSAAERSFPESDEAPRAREGAGPGRARLARRGHSASDTERALLLREEINGVSQRLEALRADHERYQSTREANERAVTLVGSLHRPRVPRTGTSSSPSRWRSCLAASSGPGLLFWPRTCPAASGATMRSRPPSTRLLSAVPAVDGMSERALFNGGSPEEDAFHRLRTTLLLHSWGDNGGSDAPRTILVTSAYPGEGKSTVVATLAAAWRTGRSTCSSMPIFAARSSMNCSESRTPAASATSFAAPPARRGCTAPAPAEHGHQRLDPPSGGRRARSVGHAARP